MNEFIPRVQKQQKQAQKLLKLRCGWKTYAVHLWCLKVNAPPSSNNLKTKVDDSDAGKLKTLPLDLKKLSDVVDNEVAKNKKFNTRKKKVNKIYRKISDVTTLIHINQYNADKQSLESQLEMFI